MRTLFAFIVFCLLSHFGFSQDFVYKPVNPSFGGDTFNYQWLLSSAQAQNLLEDPRVAERNASRSSNTLDDLTASLERNLISQLSRELAGLQFGAGGLEDGKYQIGNFQLDVLSSLDGLTINIFDASSGEQTSIFIPTF